VVIKPADGDFVVLFACVEDGEYPRDFLCAGGVVVQQLDVKAEVVERLLHIVFKPLDYWSVE